MGLGGWMVQEGYMMQTSGFAGPQYEIQRHDRRPHWGRKHRRVVRRLLQNHVQKSDIDSLKAWGFNSVRLPMHYNLWTLPIEDEPVAGENTWLDTGFELTDSLVAWCAANEMYVIWTCTQPRRSGLRAGNFGLQPGEAVPVGEHRKQEQNGGAVEAHCRALRGRTMGRRVRLAQRTQLNLPNGSALRSLYMQCTDSIRTVDPDHIIFIEGTGLPMTSQV